MSHYSSALLAADRGSDEHQFKMCQKCLCSPKFLGKIFLWHVLCHGPRCVRRSLEGLVEQPLPLPLLPKPLLQAPLTLQSQVWQIQKSAFNAWFVAFFPLPVQLVGQVGWSMNAYNQNQFLSKRAHIRVHKMALWVPKRKF